MKYLSIILIGTLLLSSKIGFTQSNTKFNANLEEVTVYRAGASLRHNVKVNIPPGSSEIIINNVASIIDESSIQVSAPANLTIMSVSIDRSTATNESENSSPEYQKRSDALKEANNNLQKTLNRIAAYDKSLAMLDQNQAIGGQNVGVNVLELGKMTDFYLNKQTELRNQLSEQKELEKSQRALVAKLSAALGALGGNSQQSNTGGQLKIQVMASATVTGNLNISYLSNAASWTAAYDIKAEKINQPINLIYKANVQQRTGLDWNKVKLSLSTGNPTLGNNAPILSTWFLGFEAPAEIYDPITSEVAVSSRKKEKSAASENKIQSYQLEEGSAPSTIDDYVTTQDNAVATTFNVDLPYNIASDNKPHAVALQSFKLNAAYKYYAVPRLDPDAFLLAEVSDYEKLNLVQGQANILFENTFVGKTNINPYGTQDTMNVSMGRDKRVIIKREIISDQSGIKFLGSSKKQTFVYEISVKNSKSESIDLLLKDQMPTSTENSIEVELLNSDNASVNKENGVLTWKLNLKPGESKKVRFSYSVKYPKDKMVDNL